MTDKTDTGLTRRNAIMAAAATLAAAKAAFPSGAFAAGAGPEVAKAR
jgi:nitrate/nitrite transport system substrate-binding protein